MAVEHITVSRNEGVSAGGLTAVVDAGTSSIRGIVFGQDGTILAVTRVSTPPIFEGPGQVTQDPLVWKKGTLEALTGCSDYARSTGRSITAVALTAFRSPVFPAYRDGTPLHPALMWQDRRSGYLTDKLADREVAVFRKSGLKISPVFSGVKMLWFVRNQPSIAARTARYLGIYEYLLHTLTGKYLTDHSTASRTNLFNLHTLDWDSELLELFEVRKDQLCRVIPPGSICGGITAETSDLTGIQAGTPVIAAGGDQQNASVGLGVTAPGRIAANTGTGSYIIGISPVPVIDPEMGIFCNAASIPGKYIIEASMLSTGTVYRWFGEQFYDRIDGETERNLFRRIDREIAASPPGARGVIVIPHFSGSGSPCWDHSATGTFCNLTLAATRGDCARAILEGIAAEMRENIDRIETLSAPAVQVGVSGGMTSFEEYNQIQADQLSREVIRYDCTEATSIGAWISSVTALGLAADFEAAYRLAYPPGRYARKIYVPDPQLSDLYRNQRRIRESIIARFRQ